jgi:organic radical activating enzyme
LTLPIHEHFYSFQGEGVHMGRAAYFIRTMGCPIQCPWCDSAGTWHPAHLPKRVERHTHDELAHWASQTKANFAVITGGEPTVHDLRPLTQALHAKGLPTHLETSGAYPIKGDIDWVTLSPKTRKLPLAAIVQRAQEIKLIIDTPDAIGFWLDYLKAFRLERTPIWLHPEWSVAQDPSLLQAIAQVVTQQGQSLRAGYQMHKLYAVR